MTGNLLKRGQKRVKRVSKGSKLMNLTLRKEYDGETEVLVAVFRPFVFELLLIGLIRTWDDG